MSAATDKSASEGPDHGRKCIHVTFDCCSVYQRVYLNKAGTAYVGWCPKCTRKITVKVAPWGTDDRFFHAN